MMTDKQLEANRQNALQSTGPKTPEGVEGCKMNAVRHGLRALETVVPGENPDDWEAHRNEIAADLDPHGAVEAALAEQVAAKLWRLGRVVRHEGDLIANAQDPDEMAQAHEKVHRRIMSGRPTRADIPTREDVTRTKGEVDKAVEKVAQWEAALLALEALHGMDEEELFNDWFIYEPLKEALHLRNFEVENLFKNEDEPLVARHVRTMFKKRGAVDTLAESVTAYWRGEKIPELRSKVAGAEKTHRGLLRRYKAALERNRRARGLPGPADLDRIQRYEAHLERGLHKALDRLHDLQAARGAVPPRAPSVAIAVVQAGPETPPADQMGPFGSFALEAANGVQEETEADGQGWS
jgi:hypothetical protein